MARISTQWTKHISGKEEKENFKSRVVYSEDVLNVLNNLLKEKVDASAKSSEQETNYEKPSWAEYQADQLGYRRALREISHLLEIKYA